MSEDTDSPQEREMKDFQFRQMKKARVFEPADDLPKERSSLLTISNKYGLTFVGLNGTFKVYLTHDILSVDKADGNANEIVEGIAPLAEVTVDLNLHHLALSCDEVTLSVCGASDDGGLSLTFYDVRSFVNKARQQKLPFASLAPAVPPGTLVQDLKWNPAQAAMLAACLSDGRMMVLDVSDSVKVQAELPASSGITCLCWSPKGKQVAAGKMNATVSQYTPILEEKKVIPCPHFYTSDDPVKVLDVLWLRTFVFAVAYAAADGSLETPPELVLISLPQKKDEKAETKYLNFSDTVYGSCTERQHHYFLSLIEDWDLVFAASAASIEVSVIARQEDKVWELWILEDASRAELPVTETNEDTLPLGLAIDYTSQTEIHITEEKTLPPVPIMLMLSTEGLLCPFALLNLNPGVKQLVAAPAALALEGERLPKPGSLAAQPPKMPPSYPPAPAAFPNLNLGLPPAYTPPPAAVSVSTAAPFSMAPSAAPSAALSAPTSSAPSSGFAFSVPTTSSSSSGPPPAFPLGASAPFGLGSSSGFSFASKPPSDTPSSASAFSFTPTVKPAVAAPSPTPVQTPQSVAAVATPAVKLNLNERFSALDTPAPAPQSFSFNSTLPKTVPSNSAGSPAPPFSAPKPAAVMTPVRPVQTSTPPIVAQKPAPAAQTVHTPQAAVSVKALEKQLQQKKDSDPIMAGILEEIGHFQKELDELKGRSSRADFKVGSTDQMKDLRKDSEDLHIFTLEIKETTESLHGDIGTLKTTLLEGFAGAEEAKVQSELSRDKNYRQLLCKKPLDPRSEDHLKEIRRLYQYVKFAVEDVNDVLDVEWEKHLERKKKQKHMVVPGREGLFTTLANNLYIINQQKNKLEQLVKELTSLKLYSKTTAPTVNHPAATAATAGLESELESLRSTLLKTKLDSSPAKAQSASPVKISPVKQSQLRNFLSKGQMPPVRSTAPANLSRSAFLSPKYYEDLDDVSSSSSLSQSLDPHPAALELEEEEEEEEDLQPEPLHLSALPPSLATPRHPAVVRTPSILPGFGAVQSTPLTKLHQAQGLGFGLSPIVSPVPSNKISLCGADSTALATKTVKHGAPPAVSAQQAAASAALRRQMANQKTVVGAALTESTLKTVTQVVNVQELKEKGLPVHMSNIISSSVPDPAPAFAVVSSNQAKRNPTQGIHKMSAESTTTSQGNFMFGQPSKADVSVAPASSTEQSSSKGFSFTSGPSGFSFATVPQAAAMSQAKDVSKFSFGANGKMMFGQSGEEPFSIPTPKSPSPALGSASPTPPPNPSGDRPSSTTPALRTDSQPPKIVGGETLGIFSGLRVGQGEEANDASSKSASSFAFGEPGLALGASQFSFGALVKPTEEPTGADLSKGAVSGSLFKPPESTPKLAFSVPSSMASSLPMSFSSLLGAPDSGEELDALPELSEPTPPPEKQPDSEPALDSPSPIEEPESLVNPAPAETTPVPASTPTPPPLVPAIPTQDPPSYFASTTEAATPTTAAEPVPTIEATPDSTSPTNEPVPTSAAVAPVPQDTPAEAQVSSSDKPGSIFTQPGPVTTDSSSLGVIPVITTVAAPTAPAVVDSTTTTASSTVFGQPAAPPASPAPSSTPAPSEPSAPSETSAPAAPSAAPVTSEFGSSGFGAPAGTGFGKSVFGQVSGFGQPAASPGSASGFSFGQSAFGASSNAATTGGGLFGAPTASNASSFSFGTGSAAPASSTSTGLFGQSTAPGFGQSSGFGQASVFGSNTTTSSSSGFSFGQPSAFGCSTAQPVFGQPASGGSVFGQQPASGGGLFGSGSANQTGAATGGGFFGGLGGKPSEEAANKNPFGVAPATGGFGQPAQTGANTLFGASGAKAFGFGQASFGEQKPGGTFTANAGSVASQGFGSFNSPTKPGGFGSAPVFGSPPSFGSAPAFGSAAAFGSAPAFPNNTMAPAASKVFGEGTAAANMGGFGFSSPPSGPSFGALASQQSAPSFGGLAQQTAPGFGAQQPSSFSGFGQQQQQQQQQQQPQPGGFSGNTFGSTNQSSPQTFASWRS